MVKFINKFNFLTNLTMDHLIMISLTRVDLVKVSLLSLINENYHYSIVNIYFLFLFFIIILLHLWLGGYIG
jgi:hypothetical protein